MNGMLVYRKLDGQDAVDTCGNLCAGCGKPGVHLVTYNAAERFETWADVEDGQLGTHVLCDKCLDGALWLAADMGWDVGELPRDGRGG